MGETQLRIEWLKAVERFDIKSGRDMNSYCMREAFVLVAYKAGLSKHVIAEIVGKSYWTINKIVRFNYQGVKNVSKPYMDGYRYFRERIFDDIDLSVQSALLESLEVLERAKTDLINANIELKYLRKPVDLSYISDYQVKLKQELL
jgi:hypothetical protein